MKKIAIAFAAASMALTGLGTAAPAAADPPPWAPAHGKRAKDRAIYDSRGYYIEPRRISRDSYIWRGRDGKYYCKRDNGTTGLVIGAGVGALAGHELAGRGDKTLGALLGAAIGGVLGREIDRGNLQCR
ncbi:glycine zipper 2TM domain-containing protein [Altererythrobacter sp. BO-6]|uniref:glycine zipper 2TM domain-containing protein n=1 Tax=Altererythrobacter sp. BO-6 TaxID=2604537 RepID=UPI0013E17D3E|nr:glycine zipper 2TM domain-containing protein [Altererythrobacter sp. BO-6]QIG55175.1 glycine zipper 2TM domain-containing protein [Altererythrobacter sp. BO-6]